MRIGYFTADTPVFSVLESDYEPARKITGVPVAEADRILKEITKRIANDDKVESAVARFRIDYVIDGMHRNYQGDFLLKSEWAESPGIIEHIRQFNYRCIHDSRFDKMDPKSRAYLNYAYNRLVPYLEKHVQARDRREVVLTTSEKFTGYFDEDKEDALQQKIRTAATQFTPAELDSAERVLLALEALL